MYSKPTEVAKAALRFLTEAKALRTANNWTSFSDHVLAAAMFANHVLQWHIRQHGDESRAAFIRRYPSHIDINEIANGVKHPSPGNVDVATGKIRATEWEDLDFWTTAEFYEQTLFITDRNGRPRSVSSRQ